ncbi:hypothetical protein TNCV_4158481 [Trichonephila clavipes]|nr:hypothetical protein TNCV_4158481 [Trichonephila clavipes]
MKAPSVDKNSRFCCKGGAGGFRRSQVVAGGRRWLQVVAGGCRRSQVVAGGRRWLQAVAGGQRWRRAELFIPAAKLSCFLLLR